jgi:hypothetical protein
MARPKGQQKLGGRTRGQTNKAKTAFRERLQAYATRHKVDPHYFMVKTLADDSTTTRLTLEGVTVKVPTVSMALKVQCAKELAQYLQPKLRSVELTGDPDNPVRHLHELPQADLDALITRLLRQTGYAGGPVPGYGGGHAALPEGNAEWSMEK